jgi:hypothetical protein
MHRPHYYSMSYSQTLCTKSSIDAPLSQWVHWTCFQHTYTCRLVQVKVSRLFRMAACNCNIPIQNNNVHVHRLVLVLVPNAISHADTDEAPSSPSGPQSSGSHRLCDTSQLNSGLPMLRFTMLCTRHIHCCSSCLLLTLGGLRL